MSNNQPSSNPISNRSWVALWPVLLLAPLSMAPKGCSPAYVGDDCPEGKDCGSAGTIANAGASTGGSAGKPQGSGGSAGKPQGTAGSAGAAPTGGTCGGLLGASCAEDLYCAFPLQAQCGAGDQTGVCQPKPDACDKIYQPVCGCDGKTYGNECEAASNGASYAHEGTCVTTNPGKACGGLKGVTCATGEFCDFPIETACGSGDQMGTCLKVPGGACDLSYSPVCGCDGKTYGNACAASTSGVSILKTGECGGPAGAECGGFIGKQCESKSQYCKYSDPAMPCGNADGTGVCTNLPTECNDIYDPVCACDGKVYGNECEAAAKGLSVLSKGKACK